MFTVLVQFNLPEDMGRQEFVAHCRKTADQWKENPRLLHKTYLYDPLTRRGGAVFLWEDSAAAALALTDAWRHQMTEFYGSEPAIQTFEAPVVIAASGTTGIIEDPAEDDSSRPD